MRRLPLALIALALGALVAVAACAAPPLPFRPAAAAGPAPRIAIRCGLHADAAIFDAVDRLISLAQARVWVEMYEFGRRDLAGALVQARARGADARLITDPTVGQSRAMAAALESAGLPLRFYPLDDSRHQIDHVKLLVADGLALVAGMNWGVASALNHDYGLEVCDPAEVARLAAIFEEDWAISGGSPSADGLSSGRVAETTPGDGIHALLLGLIESARRQIRAEVFTLTDHEVLAALASAHRRGVRVRVLLDPGQDYNRAGYALLREVGVEVRWYPVPPGTLLHAKAGLFDSRLLLGSANWSLSGLGVNHELDVETDEAASVRAFADRFEIDWAASGGGS